MPSIACRCGARLQRPDDPGVVRAVCPACGEVIGLDELPTLKLDDASPQFKAVSLEVGHVASPGGAWIGMSVRIDDRGRGFVYVNASEKGRSFQTLALTMDEFAQLTGLVQDVNNAINHLRAPGRVRGIFRGTRDD